MQYCQGLTHVPHNITESTLAVLLTGNTILSLPVDAFGTLPNCTDVDVSYNMIESVSVEAFNGLPSLSRVFLSHNKITHLDIGVFSSLPSLLIIDVKNNFITSLDPGLFNGPEKLLGIWLSYNKITTLQSGVVSGLTSLLWLDIMGNQLNQIEPGALALMPSLIQLNLHQNMLTSFPETLFLSEESNNTHIREMVHPMHLTLSSNKLHCDSSLCWVKVSCCYHLTSLHPSIPILPVQCSVLSGVITKNGKNVHCFHIFARHCRIPKMCLTNYQFLAPLPSLRVVSMA